MKMISAFIILLIIQMVGMHRASAQNQTCWKEVYPHEPENFTFNPDSVYKDTCEATPSYHAKKWFIIGLDINAINLSKLYQDSIPMATWEDIDSNYIDLKNSFFRLDSIYGDYIIIKEFPNIIDTNYEGSRIYKIQFDNNVNIGEVVSYLDTITHVTMAYYQIRAIQQLNYPTEPSLQMGLLENNDVFNSIIEDNKENHKLSLQWNLPSIKIPMAWEITFGDSSSVVSVLDDWDIKFTYPGGGAYSQQIIDYKADLGNGILNKKDLYLNWKHTDQNEKPPGGWMWNYMKYNSIYNFDGNIHFDTYKDKKNYITSYGFSGDIKMPYCALQPENMHGFNIMSIIISQMNSYGMIGIAPRARAAATSTLHKFHRIVVNPFAVQSFQYEGYDGYKTSVANLSIDTDIGLINRSNMDEEFFKPAMYDLRDSYDKQMACVSGPNFGQIVFQDDVQKKPTKVICVGVISDGNIHSNQCAGWDPRIGKSYWWDNVWEIPEMDINKQPDGYNKFILENDRVKFNDRLQLDIMAPGKSILACVPGIPESSEYTQIRNNHTNTTSGYSDAIAHVSGVILLMQSAGLEYNENFGTNAYDIITFTTNKIPPTLVIDEFYEYKPQNIDPLNRYWSRLTGYGKINAFRCVAHAIRDKGDYKYETTGSINFVGGTGSVNEDGFKLKHFGAHNESNGWVLQNGGSKYPGEPDWDNCHGTTLINGSNTILTVPNNSILAIDGILKQTTTPLSANKIITIGTGKILVTGYIENVALEGYIKVDDLKMFDNADPNNGTPFPRLIFASSPPSEIYGKVVLNGSSKIIVSSGTLTVQPGGSVELNGTQDIEINSGATLEMAYASSIKASGAQKIIIKPGGRLVIKEGAMVHLDCEVYIDGLDANHRGELVVEKNTLVYSDKITLTQYGSLTMNEGAIIMPETGKTGKIVLEEGVNFEVNNSSWTERLALIGGIDVKPGATLRVKEGSKLDLGPFNIEGFIINSNNEVVQGGKFFVEKLSNIKLFGSNNNISGYFETGINVMNETERPSITGFSGDNPYTCGQNNFMVYSTIDIRHQPFIFNT